MSCGRTHTRRQAAVARRAAPVKRRAATAVVKAKATPTKSTPVKNLTAAQKAKLNRAAAVTARRTAAQKLATARFFAHLDHVAHLKHLAHLKACHIKLRTAAESKKKVAVKKLQRPFKAPVQVKAVKAQKNNKAQKSSKAQKG